MRKYYQITLKKEVAEEYAKQLAATFDVKTYVFVTNNWAGVYTSTPIPPEGKKSFDMVFEGLDKNQ